VETVVSCTLQPPVPRFNERTIVVSRGDRKTDSETPSLCLDLSRFEANLRHLLTISHAAGKGWRPHSACHKSADIAKLQIREGAIGITCGKVSEAAVFASAGVREILLVQLPVGEARIRRMASLCRSANLIVTCDHYVQAEPLSAECIRQGVTCRALVDINIGMDRTGVRPGRDALELARAIEKLPGLKLDGIMGYEGHVLPIKDANEKRQRIDAALGILTHTRDVFIKNGLCCDIVGAGGTGSLPQSLECEGLTEVHAGAAIFGDSFDTTSLDTNGVEAALTVLTTVISRPAFDRAILDAGSTSIAIEPQSPTVKNWSDAKVVMHNAEHIALELGSSSRELRIGDQVELIVGYSGLNTMLHDEYLCFRNDRLETTWPIISLGKRI
jgi:D-serine deaminase-like pyridoxal phosphate-dependent protein